MAFRVKVLLKKSEKFELKESQKIRVNQERLSALGELLDDAYLIRRPKSSDYHHRKELVRVFNEIAKELYGNSNDFPVVEEFGSFSMDLFSNGSDLDLSINFSESEFEFPRDQKIKTLRKFAKKFYALQSRGHVSGVHPILSAKVPILKVIDIGTRIECDLSVENRDGIRKSQIVHLISSMDERFQKLSFLMKAWAKAHDINSSKDRTLNSLSIILLVAFHLQTRDPPILPPFSAILKDGTDLATVAKSVKNFLNYGKRNTESVAELFVSFLIKLASVEKLWPKGICASAYQGSWISKTWDFKVACMSVEDFTNRSQNVARAVGKSEVEDIYKCIQLSIQHVSAFMEGRTQLPKLKEYLFGHVGIKTQQAMTSNPNLTVTNKRKFDEVWGLNQQVTTLDHNLTKNMRYTNRWEGTPNGSWERPETTGWGGTPSGNWGGRTIQGWGGQAIQGWGGAHFNPVVCRSQEIQSTSQHFTLIDPSGKVVSRTVDRVCSVQTLPTSFPPHMLPGYDVRRY